MIDLADLSLLAWLLIIVAAFMSGLLHGATGMAGGVVMVAALSHIIDIKSAIVAMTVALIFSHSSRAFIYRRDTNIALAAQVLLYGVPTLILGAVIFGRLNSSIIATVFVIFLILSFPIKYWARHHKIQTSPRMLSLASVVWGMLAGNVVGPGFFLAPFLLGTGISRLTFVGTLACITLAMNVLKTTVFGATALLNWQLLLLGVVVGLATIPGNWAGRRVLLVLKDHHHRWIVDVLTIVVIVNFMWIAVQG